MKSKANAKNAGGQAAKFASFVKNNKVLFSVGTAAALIVLAVLIYFVAALLGKTKPFEYDSPQPTLTEVFGALFGINTEVSDRQEASVMEASRPADNMEIPYDQTKLSRAFDMLDKRYLYIEGTSFTLTDTGYMRVKRVYGVKDNTIYIMLDNGVEDFHIISNNKGVIGLDFDKSTYTEITGIPYSIDELLFTGGYDFCSFTGTDVFMGEQKLYEDFTTHITPSRTEWIRYYFNSDESLAGYIRYVNNDIVEIMEYDYLGSDYPDDAVVYFEIPDGFTKEDEIINWSQLFGDE